MRPRSKDAVGCPIPSYRLIDPGTAFPLKQFPSLLETDFDHGLTETEVELRLQRFGPNTISKRRGKSSFRLLLDQFTQILVVILIVAGDGDRHPGRIRG